jgi:hypothetical protein
MTLVSRDNKSFEDLLSTLETVQADQTKQDASDYYGKENSMSYLTASDISDVGTKSFFQYVESKGLLAIDNNTKTYLKADEFFEYVGKENVSVLYKNSVTVRFLVETDWLIAVCLHETEVDGGEVVGMTLNILYGGIKADKYREFFEYVANTNRIEDSTHVSFQEHFMVLPDRRPERCFRTLTSKSFEGIYSELYPGLDIQLMLEMFMQSKESLLILVGPPGTGKTSLVKRIIEHVSKNSVDVSIDCVYVKDTEILHASSFWTQMNQQQPDLLILDDLDGELSPRTETMKTGEQTIVNQMLSFTNGVFENRTKVIITSNMSAEAIDSALLRPGRCFDILELPHMTEELARDLWINKFSLSELDFQRIFGEYESITQSHFMSEVFRMQKDQSVTYLNDPNISVRNKYISSNKKTSFGFAPK